MIHTRHTHSHADSRTETFQIHTADTPERINMAEKFSFVSDSGKEGERAWKTEALSWV